MSLAVTTQVGSARCSRMKESAELANGQPPSGGSHEKIEERGAVRGEE